MTFVKAVVLAFVVFTCLAVALSLAWFAILVGAMGEVWRSLHPDAAQALGMALLAFAVLSGLALYGFTLAHLLRAVLGLSPASSWRWALAVGGLPAAVAVALGALVIANMRLGF